MRKRSLAPTSKPLPATFTNSKWRLQKTETKDPLPNRTLFPLPRRSSATAVHPVFLLNFLSLIMWLSPHTGSLPASQSTGFLPFVPPTPASQSTGFQEKAAVSFCASQSHSRDLKSNVTSKALGSLVLVPANPKFRIWVLHITKRIPTFQMWTVYTGLLTFNEVIKMELLFFQILSVMLRQIALSYSLPMSSFHIL